jgi:hypothetical protein
LEGSAIVSSFETIPTNSIFHYAGQGSSVIGTITESAVVHITPNIGPSTSSSPEIVVTGQKSPPQTNGGLMNSYSVFSFAVGLIGLVGFLALL